ncbi:MAG TPA: AtpZ/AtpI family protein [Micromonosporaceae bacterium]|nr:AtpZ/AtpI family protein [Micromonosporaceae bacterium]
MAGSPPSQRPEGSGGSAPGAGQGITAMAYLVSGIVVWGFIGWLVDRWLDTDGIATGVGAVVGAAGGVYLVVRRLGV